MRRLIPPCVALVLAVGGLWIADPARVAAQVAGGKKSASFAGTKAGQEGSDMGLKMKFCWCPAGKFTMGSPKEEKDREADENQVSVAISRGFWLGKYEVTQGEWEKIMGTTIREQRDKFDPKFKLYGEGANYPVYYVNHNEATEFCRKLTDQERKAGRLPLDWEYRLPTEAQWEHACRAGEKARFSFGDNEADLEKFGWYVTNSGRTTHEVGGKRANGWGLNDMHGNVWEWCRDWHEKALPGGIDPEVGEKAWARVLRGGSWINVVRDCRSAYRSSYGAAYRSSSIGFRVAAVQSSK